MNWRRALLTGVLVLATLCWSAAAMLAIVGVALAVEASWNRDALRAVRGVAFTVVTAAPFVSVAWLLTLCHDRLTVRPVPRSGRGFEVLPPAGRDGTAPPEGSGTER